MISEPAPRIAIQEDHPMHPSTRRRLFAGPFLTVLLACGSGGGSGTDPGPSAEQFESEVPSNVVDGPGSVPSAVSPLEASEAQRRAAGLRTGRYVCQYLSFGLGMPGQAVIVHDLELSADGTYRIRGSEESGRYTVGSGEIQWVSGPFATGEYRAEIQQEGDVARFLLILGDGQGDGKRLDCRWNVD